MAKPMSEKGLAIRKAIADNPGLGNTDLAALITGKGVYEVKPGDVAAQRIALNKASAPKEARAEVIALPPSLPFHNPTVAALADSVLPVQPVHRSPFADAMASMPTLAKPMPTAAPIDPPTAPPGLSLEAIRAAVALVKLAGSVEAAAALLAVVKEVRG